MSELHPTPPTDSHAPLHVAPTWLALASQNGPDALPEEARVHLLGPACQRCTDALAALWSERPPSTELRVEAASWPAGSPLAMAHAATTRRGSVPGAGSAGPSELSLAMRVGEATLYIDPFDAEVSSRLSADAARSARELALAELRLEAQPGGVWTVDAALAAIAVADSLGETRASVAAVPALATWRAREAIACLQQIPEQALARAGDELRELCERELAPISRWLEGTAAGESLARWLEAWPEDPRQDEFVTDAIGHEGTMAIDEVRRVPIGPRVVASGLVDAWATARVESDEGSDIWTVSVPLSESLAAIYLRAIAALESAAEGADRDRMLLRSRVLGLTGTSLPTLSLQQFDPDTGELESFTPLAVDETGVLRGIAPRIDAAVLRVDVHSREALSGRRVAAQALATLPDYWITAAEEAAGLADQILDPATLDALLRTAWVLVRAEAHSAVGLEAELRDSLSDARIDPAQFAQDIGLWTLGSELQAAVLKERAIAAGEIWRGLGPGSAALDTETQAARLAKYAEIAAQFDVLDHYLTGLPRSTQSKDAT